MFTCCHIYFRFLLPLIFIYITCVLLSLRRTSAHIHLTSVLGVLETQETSCILIAGLLERDIFELYLPEFDKPWVIHLRETCCCSTNLCTWRPNTVYKSRSICRHQRYADISLIYISYFVTTLYIHISLSFVVLILFLLSKTQKDQKYFICLSFVLFW